MISRALSPRICHRAYTQTCSSFSIAHVYGGRSVLIRLIQTAHHRLLSIELPIKKRKERKCVCARRTLQRKNFSKRQDRLLPFCCSMAPGRTVVVQPLSINLIRLLLPFASMHSARPLSLSLSSCYQMQRQYNLIFQSTLIFFFFAIPVSVPISLRAFFAYLFALLKVAIFPRSKVYSGRALATCVKGRIYLWNARVSNALLNLPLFLFLRVRFACFF